MEPKPFNQQPSMDGVNRAQPQPFGPQPAVVSPSVVTPTTNPAPTPAGPGATPDPQAPFSPQPPLTNLPPAAGKQPGKKKKLIIISLIVAAVLLAGAAAYAFFVYIPNRPQNVWDTGLSRTGNTLTKLVDQATTADALKTFDKTKITGSLDVKSDELSGNGSLSARFDSKGLDGGLNLSFSSSDGTELKQATKFKAALSDGQDYPDIYFQLTGLTDLGLDAYLPGISSYDGKWITVSSELVKSLAEDSADTTTGDQPAPTAEQYTDLTKTVVRTVNEYVFTDDTTKAVITRQSFVAKEKTSQGVEAYHYKATLNKDNAKKFCEAIVSNVMATEAYKQLTGPSEQSDEAKQTAITDCKNATDEENFSDAFDVWIDGKYKMLHKIRIDDNEDKGTYIEVGQSYQGGDTIPFFANYHGESDDIDVNMTHDLNTKTYRSTGTVSAKGTGDAGYDASFKYTVEPFDGVVDTEKPADAVPIEDVLNALGIPLDGSSF